MIVALERGKLLFKKKLYQNQVTVNKIILHI